MSLGRDWSSPILKQRQHCLFHLKPSPAFQGSRSAWTMNTGFLTYLLQSVLPRPSPLCNPSLLRALQSREYVYNGTVQFHALSLVAGNRKQLKQWAILGRYKKSYFAFPTETTGEFQIKQKKILWCLLQLFQTFTNIHNSGSRSQPKWVCVSKGSKDWLNSIWISKNLYDMASGSPNPIYIIHKLFALRCLEDGQLGGEVTALQRQEHLVWKQWTFKVFQKFRVLFSQSYTTELPPEPHVILINNLARRGA